MYWWKKFLLPRFLRFWAIKAQITSYVLLRIIILSLARSSEVSCLLFSPLLFTVSIYSSNKEIKLCEVLKSFPFQCPDGLSFSLSYPYPKESLTIIFIPPKYNWNVIDEVEKSKKNVTPSLSSMRSSFSRIFIIHTDMYVFTLCIPCYI